MALENIGFPYLTGYLDGSIDVLEAILSSLGAALDDLTERVRIPIGGTQLSRFEGQKADPEFHGHLERADDSIKKIAFRSL